MSASNWQQEVAPELLYRLITEYDQYIQQASKNECYKLEQWLPLSIEEFYQTEFKLLNIDEAEQPPEQGKKDTRANNPNTTWSTFSKQDIKATKAKSWWQRWLPW